MSKRNNSKKTYEYLDIVETTKSNDGTSENQESAPSKSVNSKDYYSDSGEHSRNHRSSSSRRRSSHSSSHSSSTKPEQLDYVIKEKSDGNGFDVDWEKIDEIFSDNRGPSRHRSSSSKHHSKNSKKSGKKKWSKKKKFFIGLLIFLLCAILGIVIAFFIMRYNGKKQLTNYDDLNISTPDGVDSDLDGSIVYYKGHTYKFNKDVVSILFMGIDNRELQENSYGSAGQSDALYLLTYDTNSGAIKVIPFNRDTMVDINMYREDGTFAGTAKKQICLSYAYGDGKSLSAQNTIISVQRLIYGIPISAYYGIDLSAIKILNDDIGGVTLTSLHTFADFTEGQTTTLKGDFTESYVRNRDISQTDSNLKRMARQRQYLSAYANQFVTITKKHFSTPITLYNHAMDYSVTNITASEVTYLASQLITNFSGLNFQTIDGKYKLGGKYAEFIPDSTSLYEVVLNSFYTRVD